MIVIYGQAAYGKVDKVPNLFHVCTQFYHLYYIPLVPLRSYLVRADAEDEVGLQGVEVPLCFRSVLAGWLRAALILCVVIGVGIGLSHLIEVCGANRMKVQISSVVVPFAVAAAAGLVWWLSHQLAFASRKRALELGAKLDLPPHVIEQLVPPQPAEGKVLLRMQPGTLSHA
jgi:hypothetical protein